MRVGIVGPGRIGGNAARLLGRAGHQVLLSFARNPANLADLAARIGPSASVGTARQAVERSDVVIFAVPWGAIPEALEQTGDFAGKIVVDTTNQFGSGPKPAAGQTAAQFNAGRMPGARYTKAFNTLTADFQGEAAGRVGDERVVQWLCGDDVEAKRVVSDLIDAPASWRWMSAAPPIVRSWRRRAGRAPSTERNTVSPTHGGWSTRSAPDGRSLRPRATLPSTSSSARESDA